MKEPPRDARWSDVMQPVELEALAGRGAYRFPNPISDSRAVRAGARCTVAPHPLALGSNEMTAEYPPAPGRPLLLSGAQ